jgi:riboflavin synthase
MFTGLIEEIGEVKDLRYIGKSSQITIKCKKILKDINKGDSISTNGVCLTVTKYGDDYFIADVMIETLEKTNLKYLRRGDSVNLERALKLGSRIGGHFVSGHIDGTAKIAAVISKDNDVIIHIECDEKLKRFMIEKGSISIEGVSLTIMKLTYTGCLISMIPTTMKDTTIAGKKIGDIVNIECDMLGKYVYSFQNKNITSVTNDLLERNGFL